MKGIYDTGNTFTNAGVIMPLPALQKLSSQDGDVTSAIVTVDSVDHLDATVSALEKKLGERGRRGERRERLGRHAVVARQREDHRHLQPRRCAGRRAR